MGYEMFRNMTQFDDVDHKQSHGSLINPGPDLVICDEGHLLKNMNASLTKSVHRIRTMRKILMTGTPIQNNLLECFCMVNFVRPNLLGCQTEFTNLFVNPIINGQYKDSTENSIASMKRRSHILHDLLNECVHRKDSAVLEPFLPKKQDFVVYVRLTDIQIKLYKVCLQSIDLYDDFYDQ